MCTECCKKRSAQKQQSYNARHTSLGKKHKGVVILGKYKDFLLFDNQSDDRILILAGECGRILENGRIFFGDGTSKSCSSLFEQLYTIHMEFGSIEKKLALCQLFVLCCQIKRSDLHGAFHIINRKNIYLIQSSGMLILRRPR